MKKLRGRRRSDETRPNIYMPHAEFVGWMKRLLQLPHLKTKLNDAIIAGGKSEGIEEEKTEYEKEYDNVHRLKDYYLKRIFQAMADLTFFFEAISSYVELQDEFESDIKDLLGIRRVNPRTTNYAFMFGSLMYSIITSSRITDDFRLKLIHKLQVAIRAKLTTFKVLETDKTTARVFEDIDRVLAWTEMISLRVRDEYDFGTKVFREQANNNKPSRTFDFDAGKLLKIKPIKFLSPS